MVDEEGAPAAGDSSKEERETMSVASSVYSHQRKKKTTLSLLYDRQLYGGSTRVSLSHLASVSAWNRKRMQNMILVVGPGTPATAVTSVDVSSSSHDEEDSSEEEDGARMMQASSDDDDDQGEEEGSTGMQDEDHESSDQEMQEDSEPSENENEDDAAPARRILSRAFQRETIRLLRRRLRRQQQQDNDEEEFEFFVNAGHDDSDDSGAEIRSPSFRNAQARSAAVRPSLRHGGCINTACWLETPWRLSTVSEQAGVVHSSISAVDTYECPTQVLTSGDDRLLKVWDVSAAMGTHSPLTGGWDTFCPFATTEMPDSASIQAKWKRYYAKRRQDDAGYRLPGTVLNLSTLSTGHRGNVFHVLPVYHQPGKVLTCAADGYLRLCDLVGESSSVVVHPYVEEDSDLSFVFHSGMAFSHVLLSANTGLLCSERGLHHFDTRLAPREQSKTSLLKPFLTDDDSNRSITCKSCAVWSPNHQRDPIDGPVESSYVFAGGSSPFVGLYDLRMDGSRARIIERYKPLFLGEDSSVSVSGIDVSRDGRELLVSYESDQIYSFPIFHEATKLGQPDLAEIDSMSTRFEQSKDDHIAELACYGGHLNRFTFLKNAKYAGPNDEYICTGSDSGHAWIYDRNACTVVSLLGTDGSTCNGVIPHPSLPFFLTYGIDSTAKLWRASPPVDPKVDDSAKGRNECFLSQPYEMSPVTRTWDGVQALLKHIDDEPAIMPDTIANSEEIAASGRFSSPCRRSISSVPNAPRIGNAIHSLPSILRQNQFECYRSFHDEMDVPVEQPLSCFSHRVSLQRLRFQADRLGIQWDPFAPWALGSKGIPEHVHAADLVPDFPSDWINLDEKMRVDPSDARSEFLERIYPDVIADLIPGFYDGKDEHDGSVPWLLHGRDANDESDEEEMESFEDRSRKLLYDTAVLLKEGGNQAVKQGLFCAAARRYDKAIQYCAVALMRYFDGERPLSHLTEGHHEIETDGSKKATSVIVNWSPLLRVLITSRLNMSLLFLKKDFSQPDRAAGHARAALKLLAPFTVRQGKVCSVRDKKEYVLKDDEPVETFHEALALQAKAHFRLGSAELESSDFASAVKSFEASLKCSSSDSPNTKPDSLVVKRLQEAKRKYKIKKKRDRARYQRLFRAAQNGNDEKGEEDEAGTTTAAGQSATTDD